MCCSAQARGQLCEEAGNSANVKYCGYCDLHYKKMVRFDVNLSMIFASLRMCYENV